MLCVSNVCLIHVHFVEEYLEQLVSDECVDDHLVLSASDELVA